MATALLDEAWCKRCHVNCRTKEKYEVHVATDLHKALGKHRKDGPPMAVDSTTLLSNPAEFSTGPGPYGRGGGPGPDGRGGGPGPDGRGGGPGPDGRGGGPGPDWRGGPPIRGYNPRGRGVQGGYRGGPAGSRGGPMRGRWDPPGRDRFNPNCPGGPGPTEDLSNEPLYGHFIRPGALKDKSPTPEKMDTSESTREESSATGSDMKKPHMIGPQPPEKWGKKFHCNVCQMTMSGPESYEQHVRGNKHKKAMGITDDESPRRVRAVKYRQDRESRLGASLLLVTSPLVGMQYMVEFQHPHDLKKDPIYECFLCDSIMDQRNVMAHITGFKHKNTYMKIHYAYMLKDVAIPRYGFGGKMMHKSGDRRNIINSRVEEIHALEGQQKVSVYLWDGKGDKPDVHTGAGPAVKRVATFINTDLPVKKSKDGAAGDPSQKTVASLASAAGVVGGTTSLLKLLDALQNFEIENEMQAGLVLKVNVALSNALKRFRNIDTDDINVGSQKKQMNVMYGAHAPNTGKMATMKGHYEQQKKQHYMTNFVPSVGNDHTLHTVPGAAGASPQAVSNTTQAVTPAATVTPSSTPGTTTPKPITSTSTAPPIMGTPANNKHQRRPPGPPRPPALPAPGWYNSNYGYGGFDQYNQGPYGHHGNYDYGNQGSYGNQGQYGYGW